MSKCFPTYAIIFLSQDFHVARSFPSAPESGEASEDVDTEAADSRAADSEATIEEGAEGVESSEELYDDDVADEAAGAGFIRAPRPRSVGRISDSESSQEADDPAFVDAASSPPPPAAPKQPKGAFADEDDLLL